MDANIFGVHVTLIIQYKHTYVFSQLFSLTMVYLYYKFNSSMLLYCNMETKEHKTIVLRHNFTCLVWFQQSQCQKVKLLNILQTRWRPRLGLFLNAKFKLGILMWLTFTVIFAGHANICPAVESNPQLLCLMPGHQSGHGRICVKSTGRIVSKRLNVM